MSLPKDIDYVMNGRLWRDREDDAAIDRMINKALVVLLERCSLRFEPGEQLFKLEFDWEVVAEFRLDDVSVFVTDPEDEEDYGETKTGVLEVRVKAS